MLQWKHGFGLMGLVLLAALGGMAPVAAQTRVNVTLNAGQTTGTLPDIAYGVNVDAGDAALRDATLPPLLTQAGVSALRFPGGSTADEYHWRTNTATAGTDAILNPHNTFDAFMATAQKIHAKPIITVNYGSNADGTGGGSPAEAAAWVTYANTTKHDGVEYWEIGDEVYGNGEYGAHWDKDLHTDHSPSAYGRNALDFITAMKAADPSIKVGVSLTAPGNWPDGVAPDWNSHVLQECGSKIDFVSIHWYPETPTHQDDQALLASPLQIAPLMTKLRALITQYCGDNAPNVEIFTTRTDPVSYNPTAQSTSIVSALFLPDDMLTWLENGAVNVDWWVLHGTPTGKAGSGDLGLFSTGQSPEPAVDTPFPSYQGLVMLGGLGRPGDRMVSATSSQPLVAVHALLRADDSVGLLVINKDPFNSYAVHATVNGFRPIPQGAVYTYSGQDTKIARVLFPVAQTFTRTVAPYSLSVIVLEPYVAPQRPNSRPRNNPRRTYRNPNVFRPFTPRPFRYPRPLYYRFP